MRRRDGSGLVFRLCLFANPIIAAAVTLAAVVMASQRAPGSPPGSPPGGAPEYAARGADVNPILAYRWAGGFGHWSDAAEWWPRSVPGQQPHLSCDMVTIGNAATMSTAVHLRHNAEIVGLILQPNALLHMEPGSILTIRESEASGEPCSIINAGRLHLWGDHGWVRLRLQGDQAFHLRNGGRLILAGDKAWIEGDLGSETLVNHDHMIEGYGRIGTGRLSLINHGEISANVPFKALTLNTGVGTLTNIGTMGSADGGWLRLLDCDVINQGGVIQAGGGSFVELDGSTIRRGTLATAGNGWIRSMDAPTTWKDVTNAGRYMLGPTELTLSGEIRNHGLIDVVGDLTVAVPPVPASAIRLAPDESGSVALTGVGQLILFSCDMHAGGVTQPAQFIHGAGHTIRGEGSIGLGDVSVVNEGLMIADGNSFLRFHPGPGRSVVNKGEIHAVGVTGAAILTGSFFNDGVVQIGDGSRFMMFPGVVAENNAGGILVGGTWLIEAHQVPAALVMNGPDILVNTADVSLIGSASTFPRLHALSSNSGVLQLLAGHNFSTLGQLHNWGDLVIDADSSLHVNGTFRNKSAGTLELRIAGDQCGHVSVNGLATLNGTLRLLLEDVDSIPSGAVFQIMTADSISGAFANVVAPPEVFLSYNEDGVSVMVHSLEPWQAPLLMNADAVASMLGETVTDVQSAAETFRRSIERWLDEP